jgi:hypothetical protein
MNRTRILSLAAVALLAACSGLMTDPQRTDVVYQADRQAYTAQDSIATVLLNTSQAEVGYNLCVATLEQRVGGGWTQVARSPEHPCALVLFTLAPGESAAWREPASAVPGPGTYRLRTSVEIPLSGSQRDVVTDPFTVQ